MIYFDNCTITKPSLRFKMRGRWGRRWTYRFAKIGKWFKSQFQLWARFHSKAKTPVETDYPPMPEVKPPKGDDG